MKAYELDTAIKKTGAGPLYLVSGEEDYLRDQAIARIKAAVLGDDAAGMGDFNIDVLYGDESDASEILARAGEVPAFAARRLVLVKGAEKLSARNGEALLPYLKSPCEMTTLVFAAPKLDGRTKLAMALKERAVVVECGPLPDQQVMGWIQTEAGRLGIRVNEDAALLLRDLVGSASLSLVKRELEKLAAYVGDGRTVGPADVEAVRGSEVGASVFDLTAAIGMRNRERVLRIVARNLEIGEAPLRILGSLVWQYRQLWKAKDLVTQSRGESEAGRILRMPPFKAREFVALFSEAHLKTAFRRFLETDSKLKGGSAMAPGRVLEGLLLDLCAREGEKVNPGRQGAARPPHATNPRAAGNTRSIPNVRSVRPPTR
ncbi:MAG: DNA polymerase III subunit delta [Nitrospiraceae bacterium]